MSPRLGAIEQVALLALVAARCNALKRGKVEAEFVADAYKAFTDLEVQPETADGLLGYVDAAVLATVREYKNA